MESRRVPSDSTVGSSSQDDRMDFEFDSSSQASSRQSSVTAPSIHEDAAPPGLPLPPPNPAGLQTMRTQVSRIAIEAQRQLNLQPKSTQLALTRKTRDILKDWGVHGAEARLAKKVEDFLSSPSTTSGLKIWSHSEAIAAADAANKRLAALKILTAHKAHSKAQAAAFAAGIDPFSIDPTTVPGADLNDSPLDGRRTALYVDDENGDSIDEVEHMPFSPADISLSIPSHIQIPPEILETTNQIIHLLNIQANAHFHHHITKYITLSPHRAKTRNGRAIIHLGLLETYSARASALFATETFNNDGFAFTQEQRSWLRECYEKIGIGLQGGRFGEMTEREISAIAHVVGLDEEAVQEYWDWMAKETRGRKAMEVWVRAREVEAGRRARLEGRW